MKKLNPEISDAIEFTRAILRGDFKLSLSATGNALMAASRVARAAINENKITVSDEERDRRMVICSSCDFFTGTTCLKCGCVARFKAKLATEHCPIEKW